MWFLMAVSLVISQAIAPLRALLDNGRVRSSLERLAIERQIHDLETGEERGLVWDSAEADRAMKFFGLMRHWKGREWGGKLIKWEPWQEHIILRPLFGWYIRVQRPEGLRLIRRYRVAWIEIPRKNSKTTTAAVIALKGLLADGEHGAEIYATGPNTEKATIVLDDAKMMIRQCPALAERTTTWKDTIVCEHWSSKLTTLPFNDPDGHNIHVGILDEVHLHPNRKLWDGMLGGSVSRDNSLFVGITTAGREQGTSEAPTISWEQHCYAKNVLEGWHDGSFVDEHFFAFITCAEEGDEPFDPQTWEKANPNWGVSVQPDKIAAIARQAKASPAATANFCQKHLNLWVGTHQRAIDIALWNAAAGPCKDLDGLRCFASVDLGFRNDFAAKVRLFAEIEPLSSLWEPDEDRQEFSDEVSDVIAANHTASDDSAPQRGPRVRIKRAKILTQFWLPEGGRRNLTQEPYASWRKRGFLTVTEGRSTDLGQVFRAIVADDREFAIDQIAIDPHNALQIGQDLVEYGLATGRSNGNTDGFCFEFWQTPRNYTEPCGELIAMLADGRLEHDGNPVMTWMMRNLVFRQNEKGVMPSKEKSAEKIDGAVALLMALGRAMFAPPPTTVGAFTLE